MKIMRIFLQYSPAGDDSVSEGIGYLVRDKLCQCLQVVFEHGIRQAVLLGTQMHPWMFIEEVPEYVPLCIS